MDIAQLHEMASNALLEGDKEKAEKYYKQIIEAAPDDEAAITSLMDIYQDTDKVKYYLTRANYNIVNGKLEYGTNDCKKALSIEPDNIEAREKLAKLYKITGKNLKAIDEFTKIIELAPDTISAYIELIDLYVKENALESAIEIAIKANEKFGTSANFNDVLAKLYFDYGDYKKALEVVSDEVLKIKILLQYNKNEEAKAMLDKHKPENFKDKEQKAMYYLLLAQYYYNKENYNEALDLIEKYSSIMGPNALSFQMKALCYEGLNDNFMAAFSYAYMNKALNKQEDALVEFNNAYVINPKNKDVLIELAHAYENIGEKYTAIDFWQKVYELDNDETARGILAEFYLKEGDKAMAERFGATSTEALKNEAAPVEEDEGLLNKILNFFGKK